MKPNEFSSLSFLKVLIFLHKSVFTMSAIRAKIGLYWSKKSMDAHLRSLSWSSFFVSFSVFPFPIAVTVIHPTPSRTHSRSNVCAHAQACQFPLGCAGARFNSLLCCPPPYPHSLNHLDLAHTHALWLSSCSFLFPFALEVDWLTGCQVLPASTPLQGRDREWDLWREYSIVLVVSYHFQRPFKYLLSHQHIRLLEQGRRNFWLRGILPHLLSNPWERKGRKIAFHSSIGCTHARCACLKKPMKRMLPRRRQLVTQSPLLEGNIYQPRFWGFQGCRDSFSIFPSCLIRSICDIFPPSPPFIIREILVYTQA